MKFTISKKNNLKNKTKKRKSLRAVENIFEPVEKKPIGKGWISPTAEK